MITTEQQAFNAMRNAMAAFIEYNDNGGPLSFDVDAMWANARAALAGAEGVQTDIKEERGIIRNFDFMGFHLLKEKGLIAVISETEDGKRGVLKIEPIDAFGGAA